MAENKSQAAAPALPIGRFSVPALEALPEDMRARILEMQEKSRVVPNAFLAFAHRPDEFRAFFTYHDALMLKPSGLSRGERKLIVVTTTGANDCLYCVVAHGTVLRIYEKNALIANQVAVNYRKADISPRRKAMLGFAMKVCLDSRSISDADYATLRRRGFPDEDPWDIAATTALFGLSNWMANAMSMPANDEFYLLGRAPRAAKG